MKKILNRSLSVLKDKIQCFLIDKIQEEPKPRISVFPFISGDLFLALADVVILSNQFQPIILRNRKDILFVEADVLEEKLKLKYALQFKSIIVHNGDNQLSKTVIEILTGYGCIVFATNVKVQPPNVFPVPIGIENAHLRRNGGIHYFNPLNIANISLKKERDVLVSFNTSTNPYVRMRIEKLFVVAGYINEKLSIANYRNQLAKSRFVISPPGNGIDCHRTWEAFYHKTIPVIEKKYWMFVGHELPVLVVDDLNDFINLSSSEKIKYYEQIINEKSYDAIYFDYWIEFIHNVSRIRQAPNYENFIDNL